MEVLTAMSSSRPSHSVDGPRDLSADRRAGNTRQDANRAALDGPRLVSRRHRARDTSGAEQPHELHANAVGDTPGVGGRKPVQHEIVNVDGHGRASIDTPRTALVTEPAGKASPLFAPGHAHPLISAGESGSSSFAHPARAVRSRQVILVVRPR